uniref:E3 ubiquitin-protein ligase E3D n=1 Tax=Crassostrea virginica TaxID=6565 RepID=A0A8B8EWP6_CRAVI|nr:E3 ubiquitin-protein ligase E3D-like [Crassostrea virginica]
MAKDSLTFHEVKIFAEHKQTMGHINVHLHSKRFSKNIVCDNFVTVENDTLSVEDANLRVSFKFKDLMFESSTCRNLQYDRRGELTFTVQADKPNSETVSVAHRNHDQQDQYIREIKTYQDRCYCNVCGKKVLKDSCHFLRVMPLPSDNWSDFSDMWFCHNHSHSDGFGDTTDHKMSDLELKPKLKDCFVAETYFLVHSDQISPGSILPVQDACLSCRRCRNILGEVMPEKNGQSNGGGKIFKMLRSSVCFSPDLNFPDKEALQFSKEETECMFAKLVMEHSRVYTSFKLCVTTSTDRKQFDCLMWIIDPNLMIFTGSSNSDVNILTPFTAVKVLFKTILERGASNESTGWKKDNSIHMISLPHSSCLSLVKILIDNCKTLPMKSRKHQEFNVGYLKFQKKATLPS